MADPRDDRLPQSSGHPHRQAVILLVAVTLLLLGLAAMSTFL